MKIKQPRDACHPACSAGLPAMASNALQVEDEFNAFYMAGTDGAAGHVLRPPYDPRVLERLDTGKQRPWCLHRRHGGQCCRHRPSHRARDQARRRARRAGRSGRAEARSLLPRAVPRHELPRHAPRPRTRHGACGLRRAGDHAQCRGRGGVPAQHARAHRPPLQARCAGAGCQDRLAGRRGNFRQRDGARAAASCSSWPGSSCSSRSSAPRVSSTSIPAKWESADRPLPVPARATELLYFQVGQDPNSPYGVPRWEGKSPRSSARARRRRTTSLICSRVACRRR